MTPIVVGMLKPLLWLLPLVVLGGVLKSPRFKGWLGERKVRNLLRGRLAPSVYREFSNVTVRDEFGDTTQIDHVYVSRYGVFVLETKHMGHWIYGSQDERQWTQRIFGKAFKFQNPLRQNYRHVKVLASLLRLPDEVFRPVVVFSGDCTFKTGMPDAVRTCSNLVQYFHSIDEQMLTDGQVESICQDLQRLRLEPSWQTHRQHVDSLRRRHGAAPSIATAPARRAESFAEAAGERLLRAVEDRIRNDGRRHASRAAQFGLTAILAKALVTLVGLGLVWWFLATAFENAARSLAQPKVVSARVPATASPPVRTPAARVQIDPAPVFISAAPQPPDRQPTAQELAEQRRRAEEARRILEQSTPEVPLALPGSPVVGPSAYSERGARTDGDRAAPR